MGDTSSRSAKGELSVATGAHDPSGVRPVARTSEPAEKEYRTLIMTRHKLSFASRDGQIPVFALSSCFDPLHLASSTSGYYTRLEDGRWCSQAPRWVGDCIPSATHCLGVRTHTLLGHLMLRSALRGNPIPSIVATYSRFTVLARMGLPYCSYIIRAGRGRVKQDMLLLSVLVP